MSEYIPYLSFCDCVNSIWIIAILQNRILCLACLTCLELCMCFLFPVEAEHRSFILNTCFGWIRRSPDVPVSWCSLIESHKEASICYSSEIPQLTWIPIEVVQFHIEDSLGWQTLWLITYSAFIIIKHFYMIVLQSFFFSWDLLLGDLDFQDFIIKNS